MIRQRAAAEGHSGEMLRLMGLSAVRDRLLSATSANVNASMTMLLRDER